MLVYMALILHFYPKGDIGYLFRQQYTGKREHSYHLRVVGNKIPIDTATQGPKASCWPRQNKGLRESCNKEDTDLDPSHSAHWIQTHPAGIFPGLEYLMEIDKLRCWQNPYTCSLTNKLKLYIIKSYHSKKAK